MATNHTLYAPVIHLLDGAKTKNDSNVNNSSLVKLAPSEWKYNSRTAREIVTVGFEMVGSVHGAVSDNNHSEVVPPVVLGPEAVRTISQQLEPRTDRTIAITGATAVTAATSMQYVLNNEWHATRLRPMDAGFDVPLAILEYQGTELRKECGGIPASRASIAPLFEAMGYHYGQCTKYATILSAVGTFSGLAPGPGVAPVGQVAAAPADYTPEIVGRERHTTTHIATFAGVYISDDVCAHLGADGTAYLIRLCGAVGAPVLTNGVIADGAGAYVLGDAALSPLTMGRVFRYLFRLAEDIRCANVCAHAFVKGLTTVWSVISNEQSGGWFRNLLRTGCYHNAYGTLAMPSAEYRGIVTTDKALDIYAFSITCLLTSCAAVCALDQGMMLPDGRVGPTIIDTAQNKEGVITKPDHIVGGGIFTNLWTGYEGAPKEEIIADRACAMALEPMVRLLLDGAALEIVSHDRAVVATAVTAPLHHAFFSSANMLFTMYVAQLRAHGDALPLIDNDHRIVFLLALLRLIKNRFSDEDYTRSVGFALSDGLFDTAGGVRPPWMFSTTTRSVDSPGTDDYFYAVTTIAAMLNAPAWYDYLTVSHVTYGHIHLPSSQELNMMTLQTTQWLQRIILPNNQDRHLRHDVLSVFYYIEPTPILPVDSNMVCCVWGGGSFCHITQGGWMPSLPPASCMVQSEYSVEAYCKQVVNLRSVGVLQYLNMSPLDGLARTYVNVAGGSLQNVNSGLNGDYTDLIERMDRHEVTISDIRWGPGQVPLFAPSEGLVSGGTLVLGESLTSGRPGRLHFSRTYRLTPTVTVEWIRFKCSGARLHPEVVTSYTIMGKLNPTYDPEVAPGPANQYIIPRRLGRRDKTVKAWMHLARVRNSAFHIRSIGAVSITDTGSPNVDSNVANITLSTMGNFSNAFVPFTTPGPREVQQAPEMGAYGTGETTGVAVTTGLPREVTRMQVGTTVVVGPISHGAVHPQNIPNMHAPPPGNANTMPLVNIPALPSFPAPTQAVPGPAVIPPPVPLRPPQPPPPPAQAPPPPAPGAGGHPVGGGG